MDEYFGTLNDFRNETEFLMINECAVWMAGR